MFGALLQPANSLSHGCSSIRHFCSSDSPTTAGPGTSSGHSDTTTTAEASIQRHQSISEFSTAPDAFTAHLQQKTEQDVFALLERARAAKLAEAAAEAKAAAAGSVTADGAVVAAVADIAEEEDDDTVDVINPETGEVRGCCFHSRSVVSTVMGNRCIDTFRG
jgi:hypothetical protein